MEINNKIKLLLTILKILKDRNLTYNEAVSIDFYFKYLNLNDDDPYMWIEILSKLLGLFMSHDYKDENNSTIFEDSLEYEDSYLRQLFLDGFVFTNEQFQYFCQLQEKIKYLSDNYLSQDSVYKL